jgi:hypothetical protein
MGSRTGMSLGGSVTTCYVRARRVTVEVVDSTRFRAGTELRWRRDRSRWWSGVRFVLQDPTGYVCAAVADGFSGRAKRIVVGDRAYRVRPDGLWMTARVIDESNGADTAVLRFKKSSGFITITDGPTLRCERVGVTERTLQIFDGDVTAMTITWKPMSRLGFAEGSATLGEATLGDDTALVACLAFQYFIPKAR